MLNSPKKLCKNCWKSPPHTGRRDCLSCIQKKEKEKARERAKKEKAHDRINIRISWIEEEDRNELREVAKKAISPFLRNKQITIKVSRGKSNSELAKLEKKADDLWSKAVKVNYSSCCQHCCTTENLNSHHLFTRSRRATRWEIENGICLCASHHTFSQEFSAHKTPAKFKEWFVGVKWEKHYNDLEKKSRSIFKVTPEFLKEKIQELEEFIKINS